MVLMNLFLQGSNTDTDIENRLIGKGRGEEREGEMNGESSMETYTLTYVKRQPMEICSMTQVVTKRGGKGWEVGGRFKKEGTCIHLWLTRADV